MEKIISASHTPFTGAQTPINPNDDDGKILSDLFADLDDVKIDPISNVGSLDSTTNKHGMAGEDNNSHNSDSDDGDDDDDDDKVIYQGPAVTSPTGDGDGGNRHGDIDSDDGAALKGQMM